MEEEKYEAAIERYKEAAKQVERARAQLSEADQQVAAGIEQLQRKIAEETIVAEINALLELAREISGTSEAGRAEYYEALKLVEEILQKQPDLEAALALQAELVRQLNRAPRELREVQRERPNADPSGNGAGSQ